MTTVIDCEVTYNFLGQPGHKSKSSWEKTDYYCPSCGKQAIYNELGEGDYYVGPDFVCITCNSNWTMQGPNIVDKNRPNYQVIEQIKKAIEE